jgi:hypothetical protein
MGIVSQRQGTPRGTRRSEEQKGEAMALSMDQQTVRDDSNRKVWHVGANHARLPEKVQPK